MLDIYLKDDIYRLAYRYQYDDVMTELTQKFSSDPDKNKLHLWLLGITSWHDVGHTISKAFKEQLWKNRLSVIMGWKSYQQIQNKSFLNHSICHREC